MKLSVSLSAEDVETLDAYVERAGLRSRSAAVQRAIRGLRHPDLEDDYRSAWIEWVAAGEEDVWGQAVGDGINDAPR